MNQDQKNNVISTLKELEISDNIIQRVLETCTNEEEAVDLALACIEDNESISSDEEKIEETKMVLVVRNDLGMGVGKIAAQVGHAGILKSLRYFPKCTK